jgi:hypothetical protein
MFLGSVVSTILVIVVTAEVSFQVTRMVLAFLCVIRRVLPDDDVGVTIE